MVVVEHIAIIESINYLVLTHNGDFRLANLPPMQFYQPIIKELSIFRMGQKYRLYFFISRRNLIESPTALANSTYCRTLDTTESNKLVSWENSNFQPQLSQVCHKDVLGLLLFLIYIHDLSGISSSGSIVLFAGDHLVHHLIIFKYFEDFENVGNGNDKLCN